MRGGLAARPVGMPKRSDWVYTEEPVADPGPAASCWSSRYVSLDPAMRGWMNEGKSYIPPVEIGAVMRAIAVGSVIASRNPKYAVGDYVSGTFGVQEYALSTGDGLAKIDTGTRPVARLAECLRGDGNDSLFRPARRRSAENR